ncbi:MAG: hypothetical protein RR646_02690 [Erysipelotrichaceae bacterium]
MKQYQTSITNGISNVLFPMEITRISQVDNVGSHLGSFALDLSGSDGGKSLIYAPCDVVCVAIDPKNGNAVWWQSISKVRFANGIIDYLTLLIIHDDSLSGIHTGISYKQGTQIAQEGSSGNATGNHIHIEFARGKFNSMYVLNRYGVYMLNGNMLISDVCFIDGTKLLNDINYNWKYVPSIINNKISIGDKFSIAGIFLVQQVLVELDSIWNKELTGDGGNSIPAGPCIKCDKYGNRLSNQVFKLNDYFYIPGIFISIGYDLKTDATKFIIANKTIWVYNKVLTKN